MGDNKRLNAAERKALLEAYLAQCPESVALLGCEVGETPLDYSPASLIGVWESFLAHFSTREKSTEELMQIPDWVRDTTPTVTFTEETKYRIVRAAFYLGEVFVRAFPQLKWDVSKSGAYRNKVVLLGFQHGLEFCPLSMVEVQAWKAVRHSSPPTALRELFEIWGAKVL